ncbi:MAG TPA: VWA domain-containing protein, partial [Acidobacteriota bacterium]|nr:VWA domain-containing protein [Acidobacteriota bacterium]
MFFQPWGFLLLTGLGALLAIYFLQRRFRSRQVSSLMLWRLPRLPQQGGRTWRRLRTPPPFWLELLVIMLLALAAAAPHFKLRENRRPLAVVLDDSFSMKAGSVDLGQPEEAAREASDSIASPADSPRALALGALMEELGQGRHAPVHLVLAGQEASLLAQGLRDQEAVLGALDGWKCQAPSADLASGVALARRLAGDLGRVLVLSDHAPETDSPAQTSDGPDSAAASGQDLDAATGSESEDGQPYLEAGETRAGASPFVHWSFGRPRGNLALINAGRSSASSRNFVEVANLGDSPVRAVVKIETLRSAAGAEADAADASDAFRQPEGSDGRSAQPAGG